MKIRIKKKRKIKQKVKQKRKMRKVIKTTKPDIRETGKKQDKMPKQKKKTTPN